MRAQDSSVSWEGGGHTVSVGDHLGVSSIGQLDNVGVGDGTGGWLSGFLTSVREGLGVSHTIVGDGFGDPRRLSSDNGEDGGENSELHYLLADLSRLS